MYPEIDYFIDETNNGWVNGVPAKIANKQMNDMIRDRLTYSPSFGEYVSQLFNYFKIPKEQRVDYIPYALGF